jgi:hypothetical protein
MASTRNKNNIGNYQQETKTFRSFYNHMLNPQSGVSYQTSHAGNGLIAGRLPWDKLSENAADTESFLFGINSTNLVAPTQCFIPKSMNLETVDIFEKPKVMIPLPLIIKPERPHLH